MSFSNFMRFTDDMFKKSATENDALFLFWGLNTIIF